jgi:dolichol-phosphate mannosyltransferase
MRKLVIIPTYNERENIAAMVAKVFSLEGYFHLLVIDDGSPDGTGDLVEEFSKSEPRVHLMRRKGKLGLGSAYVAGFKWALERDYQYIFEMDADLVILPKI